MQCAAPAWLASGTKMGHAGLGGVPACFAHHANAGRFASQSLACIRIATRAKFYRQHRIHLDEAGNHGIGVVTAGTLVADDGETPIGSLFVVDAEDRTTLDAFTRSDPYYVNGVWETVEIHAYRKKRGS